MNRKFLKIKVSKVKNGETMKCSKPDSDLIFYLEGTLSDDRITEIEAHLSKCQVCSGFLDAMKRSFDAIEKEKVVLNDPFFYTRLVPRKVVKTTYIAIPFKKFVPALIAATLFAGGVFTGINIGKLFPAAQYKSEEVLTKERSYLDELDQESIETFFLTINNGENE
jgi:hypothetical protein